MIKDRIRQIYHSISDSFKKYPESKDQTSLPHASAWLAVGGGHHTSQAGPEPLKFIHTHDNACHISAEAELAGRQHVHLLGALTASTVELASLFPYYLSGNSILAVFQEYLYSTLHFKKSNFFNIFIGN